MLGSSILWRVSRWSAHRTNQWVGVRALVPYRCTSLLPLLFAGRRAAVMRRYRPIGMWCRGWICRGRLGIATGRYNVRPRSKVELVVEGCGGHTLENRDVCAETAAKGVCSGSGASIVYDYQLCFTRWRVSSAMCSNP